MKSHFQQLLAYHNWANQLFMKALQQHHIPAARRLFSHVLHAQRMWLLRINGQPGIDFWSELPPKEWEAYHQRDQQATLALLEEDRLDERISYHNSRGNAYEDTIQNILQHLINHATHHRGQIALLLRQHGIAPPPSDYIYYLREMRGED